MAQLHFAQKLKELFSLSRKTDTEFFESLADTLIEGDLGAKTAFALVEELEKRCKTKKISDEAKIRNELGSMLLEYAKAVRLDPEPTQVNIYLVLGVNGVGKTTSIAKMAYYYEGTGKYNVVMAAADTFRAAAIEQISAHGERLGIRVVSHHQGSDPAAVIFDAADAVAARGGGLVLADTAGRLHNKENLVRELQKIDRIAASKASAGAYKKILVLDATTGQNALRQAEVFNEAVGIDGVILTKYDSTARGGVVFSLGRDLGLPLIFTAFGEGYGDIAAFDPVRYTADFLGI